jgi:hypothetical protein
MKHLLAISIVGLSLVAIGCQNDEAKRQDTDSATAGRYSGSTSSTITGSSQQSSANNDVYGTQRHSGTLSSSSTSDPNSRTMGGGQ